MFNIQVCQPARQAGRQGEQKVCCLTTTKRRIDNLNRFCRCSPKVWFERRAAAAENAAVSAVLEEVKGITESLTIPSVEGVEDKVVEDEVIEDKEEGEEEEVKSNGDAAGIILSANNLKAMLEPEPLLVSNGGHRVARAEPDTLMGRKEEQNEIVSGRGGYFARGVEGVQTLV